MALAISTKNPYVFGALPCAPPRATRAVSLTHTLLRRPFPPPSSAEDTDDETLELIKSVVAEIFDNPPPNAMFGEMARRIRVELDKRLESRGWSVVVGRAYGAYLTHKIQSFCVRAAAVSRMGRARTQRTHSAATPPPPHPFAVHHRRARRERPRVEGIIVFAR